MSKRHTQPGPLNSEAEALFELGRASHSPTAADRARIRAALARKLQDVPAQATGGWSGRARLTASGNLVKLGIGAACLIAGTFVATRGIGTKPDAAPAIAAPAATLTANESAAPATARAVAAPTTPEPSPNGALRSSAGEVPTRQREAAQQPGVRPSTPLKAKRASLDAAQSARDPKATRTLEPESAAGTALEAHKDVQATEAKTVTLRPQPSAADVSNPGAIRAQPRPTAQPGTAQDQPEDRGAVRSELAFITRIHAALRDGQPRMALTLCTEHQQRWPSGSFVQEREGLRAIAACAAGAAGADALARGFVVKYPRGPLTARVRDACGAQP